MTCSRHRRPIMIMGCTSDAGKSFLTTALCRYYARKGLRVAPFKGQQISNNAAVTHDGQEMGRAQFFQAKASRILPTEKMNPVLLKPSHEGKCEVIVLGRVDEEAMRTHWTQRSNALWPRVQQSLCALMEEYDLVIIEGAGSPAEPNLRHADIVNFRVAHAAKAHVYLVADIDRGGAFAHLYGTYLTLDSDDRALIKGFILNKFIGDVHMLGEATDWLEQKTGVPVVGVIPMVQHLLPEEDMFHHKDVPVLGQINIALIMYPFASNLDEFDPLIYAPNVNVIPIRRWTGLDGYDAILLPGSKNSYKSLAFLRTTGLEKEILEFASHGKLVMGVCGGMQILGNYIHDENHIEGEADVRGLGLLDLETWIEPQKTTRQRETEWRDRDGSSVKIRGYEIHRGKTIAGKGANEHLPDGLGWCNGNIYGVYLHGLFENRTYCQNFLEQIGWQGAMKDWNERVEKEIDKLADLVETSGWGDALGTLEE
ncbi:uncharacterized protein VTP21DRAFT_3991 [Calcarisporiella thermophila]|uniref:uncharacterized protein n=1 Tax=Calcarisporiella thermophila TaxID=911321 RepID=UPI0037434663